MAAHAGALERIERALAQLPEDAWQALCQSALGQVDRRHPARGWIQAIDRFNEARAFHHLGRVGCSDIRFAPASASARAPDLLAELGGERVACEVKTLHLAPRATEAAIRRKIAARTADALAQLQAVEAELRILYLIAPDPGPLVAAILDELADALVPDGIQLVQDRDR